jgi:hypothetical protein
MTIVNIEDAIERHFVEECGYRIIQTVLSWPARDLIYASRYSHHSLRCYEHLHPHVKVRHDTDSPRRPSAISLTSATLNRHSHHVDIGVNIQPNSLDKSRAISWRGGLAVCVATQRASRSSSRLLFAMVRASMAHGDGTAKDWEADTGR